MLAGGKLEGTTTPAKTGRYEAKVSPPELVAGFRAEKTSLVNETLDALSQLSNSPSVLYFESAPDAVFRKPTPPPPLHRPPTKSNIMFLGDIGPMLTPQVPPEPSKLFE